MCCGSDSWSVAVVVCSSQVQVFVCVRLSCVDRRAEGDIGASPIQVYGLLMAFVLVLSVL